MNSSCIGLKIIMTAVALLSLARGTVYAQGSISAPLSGSIGDSIYSESTQTGPSTSLLPGGANLTNPFLRTGTSDPLGFLIESGFMSPYTPEAALISSYAEALVSNQVVNDSTVAERFNEYSSNRDLMSGAGSTSTLAGRSASAGATLSARSGARAASAASGAFSGLTTRAPFAAGSSALAARQAGAAGMNSFVDPNALVAAASSSPSVAGIQADAGTGLVQGSGATGTMNGSDAQGTMLPYGANGLGIVVPPPTSTASGPGPGSVFADTETATVAANGLPDSTMGTAGLSMSASETPFSRPILTGEVERGDPFPSMSGEVTSFLHPTLAASRLGPAAPGATGTASSQAESLREATRKARLHAMIYHPSAMPSAFDQRALLRSYERSKERQVHRRTTLTAPSVTP